MKIFKLQKIVQCFVYMLCVIMFSCSDYKYSSTAKTSINLKLYKGVVLVGIQPTYGMLNEPLNTYIYTFRNNDSIWSEIYRYEVMESFKIGDTLN